MSDNGADCGQALHEHIFGKKLTRKEKKCQRKGHVPVLQERRGYKDAPWDAFRAIAYRVIWERYFCTRCKKVLVAGQEIDSVSIQSLTMDPENMDILRREGMYWRNNWETKG